MYQRVLQIFDETSLYNSSFDVFHLSFSESRECQLFTFDKGFKKLQGIAKIEIKILE